MTDTFFAQYWYVCVSISFIHFSIILTLSLASFSLVNTASTTLKFTTNYCISLRINLPEMSCGKRWKWRFQDPKIKTLLGEHAPGTP